MTISQNLKNQIIANLEALVASGILGAFISQDTGKDPLTIDPEAFPFAIVSMPQVAAAFEDTANNLRTYRWDILFMQKVDNLVDGQVEELIDRVINQFDDNFTLAGVAQGSVLPAEVLSWPSSSGDKAFSCFVVTLKARALYTLGSTDAIPGPGNIHGIVNEEQVAGTDGTHWTLAMMPTTGSVHLYASGQPLFFAAGDYTISGQNITTTKTWPAGSVFAFYTF